MRLTDTVIRTALDYREWYWGGVDLRPSNAKIREAYALVHLIGTCPLVEAVLDVFQEESR